MFHTCVSCGFLCVALLLIRFSKCKVVSGLSAVGLENCEGAERRDFLRTSPLLDKKEAPYIQILGN